MSPPSRSLQRLEDIVDYVVDERVGIIGRLTELPKEPGAPDFFYYYAEACNTRALCGQRNFANSGGVSSERGLAMAKAIGEAVERYCAALYDPDDFHFCSYHSAPFRRVSPCKFALYNELQYSQEGFPYIAFTEKTPVQWTSALNLHTGESWYVPAAMVFIPYFYDRDRGEFPIVQPISTGLACHCSQAEAAISAVCEVIERDAFTITWQARMGMPQIVTETLSKQNHDIVARFERSGSSVFLFNITLDHGVPTILSVLRNMCPESPALVVAASAALNPEEAVRKSLEEAAHTRRFAQRLKKSLPAFDPGRNFEKVVDQASHVRLFCDQKSLSLVDFLFSSEDHQDFRSLDNLSTGDPKRDLKTLADRIRGIGYQVFLSDVTTRDITDLGLSVVRAVIPGLHPLFMGQHLRALGGSRLWQLPQRLCYGGITPESGDNPVPHPYP